ncbi:MAG: hypothetical protein PVG39_01375 [Desulfobacteraceae bacterium]
MKNWTEKEIMALWEKAKSEKPFKIDARWDKESAVHLIDEMAELTHAILKANKYGLFNFHPERPNSNNLIELVHEICDVEEKLDAVKKSLLAVIEHRHN